MIGAGVAVEFVESSAGAESVMLRGGVRRELRGEVGGDRRGFEGEVGLGFTTGVEGIGGVRCNW
jgi:hypothetical protein